MDGVPAKLDAPESSRARILFLLKTRGPMVASKLARRLGVTPMAVHRHLSALARNGLVAFTVERRKVGRPVHLWKLTAQAHMRFPDRHGELAVSMLQAIRAAFGHRGLARVMEEHMRQQISSYRERMPPKDASIEERVAALAEIRRTEGFMAEWARCCAGTIELVEHHCAIATAARCCASLCDDELSLFRVILGDDVKVDRVEHVLRGDCRCAFQIVQ